MTFLLLFSIFTSSELSRHVTSSYREKGFSNYQTQKALSHKKQLKALLQQFKSKVHAKNPHDLEIEQVTPKKQPSSGKKTRCYKLNFDLTRPPDNARFNIRPFLINPEKTIGGKAEIEIFEELIRNLYKDAPFFQKIPFLERSISSALLREKDKFLPAQFADVIGSLSFEDDDVRIAFYKMLKGQDSYPSLLNYLACDAQTKTKINILFADPELIHAMLDNEHAAKRIVAFRNNLIAQMRLPDTELTRSHINNQLRDFMDLIIQEENLSQDVKQRFDYFVGKPGRLIFVRDPLTQKLHFEKVPLPQSNAFSPQESDKPLAQN